MTVTTHFEPLTRERARQLAGMLQEVQQDEGKGIALDEHGTATGVVEVDDPFEEHLLGDLDVHA